MSNEGHIVSCYGSGRFASIPTQQPMHTMTVPVMELPLFQHAAGVGDAADMDELKHLVGDTMTV